MYRNVLTCLIQNRLSLNKINKIPIRKMSLIKEQAYVNGEWILSDSDKKFEVLNPANGNTIASVPDMDETDTEKSITAAYEAFKTWKDTTPYERSKLLRNWYELVKENEDQLASIITAESGKHLREAKGEILYANSFLEWFSEGARRIHGEIIQGAVKSKKALIERQPIGVVGLITPWNFPMGMITRKAGAALAAGCTCVIKPSEDTPLTALALVDLAHRAGFPKGVVNVVTSSRAHTPKIGKLLCESPLVAGISFTGSVPVGKLLFEQCAKGIKRLGLELGGNAPFIVYDSANLEVAIKAALISKFRNCGQACIASNRFFIHEKIYDEFVNSLVEEVKKFKLGEGINPDCDLGPVINKPHLKKISELVQDARDKGASILTGGKPASSVGELFYEPTIITDLTKAMRIYNEEVFGPILSIIKFSTEEESINMANNTKVGLAAYIFTENNSQIFRVSRALEVGMVGVNEGLISAAEVPFGGVKESGIGREGSHHGIEEFTYYKYICLGNLS